jgi:hypothetical protein
MQTHVFASLIRNKVFDIGLLFSSSIQFIVLTKHLIRNCCFETSYECTKLYNIKFSYIFRKAGTKHCLCRSVVSVIYIVLNKQFSRILISITHRIPYQNIGFQDTKLACHPTTLIPGTS